MTESTQLIVNIAPKADHAMTTAAETTGLTRTDTVSRALTLYAHVVATKGGQALAFERPDGTWRHLHITDHRQLPADVEIVEAAR